METLATQHRLRENLDLVAHIGFIFLFYTKMLNGKFSVIIIIIIITIVIVIIIVVAITNGSSE
jgi:hypothetical protein